VEVILTVCIAANAFAAEGTRHSVASDVVMHISIRMYAPRGRSSQKQQILVRDRHKVASSEMDVAILTPRAMTVRL